MSNCAECLMSSPDPLMFADDFLDSHELDLIGTLHLLQPAGDVAYRLLDAGDKDMFQGVDPTAGHFNLMGEKLDSLPEPRHLE